MWDVRRWSRRRRSSRPGWRSWATVPAGAWQPPWPYWPGTGAVPPWPILIYPMLDDRNATPDPEIAPFAVWSYDDNLTGWGTLLGDAIGTDKVPAYAAPARATDLSGLPACYIEVVSSTSFVTKTLITPCVSAEPVYLSSSTSAPACRTSSKLTATPPTSPAVPRRTASGCSVRFRQRFRQALRATRPIKATRPTKGATSDRRRPHQIPSVVGTAR
jgi:hypothetical protein